MRNNNMSNDISGADLLAALAERYEMPKTAAETLVELTPEEIDQLDEDDLAALIEMADAELAEAVGEDDYDGEEKTASEIVNEMSEEELAQALSEMSPEEIAELQEQVALEEAEQEKVAALMSGAFDEQALAGQVWGTAAGEAFTNSIKIASEDDDDEWEYVDPAELSAEDFIAGLESGEIVELDGEEKVAEDEELDLSQISAEDFLMLLEEEDETEKLASGRIKALASKGWQSYKGAITGKRRSAAAAPYKDARKAYHQIRGANSKAEHQLGELKKHRTEWRKGLGIQVGTMAATAAPIVVPSAVFARRRKK